MNDLIDEWRVDEQDFISRGHNLWDLDFQDFDDLSDRTNLVSGCAVQSGGVIRSARRGI